MQPHRRNGEVHQWGASRYGFLFRRQVQLKLWHCGFELSPVRLHRQSQCICSQSSARCCVAGSDAPRSARAPRVSLLIITSDDQERSALKRVLDRSNWLCLYARTVQEGIDALAATACGVVVTAHQLHGGCCWKDVLDVTRECPGEPRLIVTCPQPDGPLWAEVLNLGGYDLLIQPFDKREVFQVLTTAWLSWWRSYQATAITSA